MKLSTSIKSITLTLLLGTALAAPVLAQGGPGMGRGAAMQNCAMGGGRGAAGMGGMGGMNGMGPCDGAGWATAYDQDSVRGWSLMTPAERATFQRQMRDVKTYEQCIAVQTEHRGAMEVRAKERGVTLPTPRQNVCETLKARGVID